MKSSQAFAAAGAALLILLNSPGHAQTPSFNWARRVAGTMDTDFELAIGLAIDRAANLYVTGWFDGTNDFGNGIILTNDPGGGQDIFVAKYNSKGMIQWARRAGSSLPEHEGGRGIGLDNARNVYVTGGYVGYAEFDGIVLSGGDENLFFLAKYDSEGTIQWVRQSAGARDHYGTGLAVDGAGNCYAVGYIDNLASITFDQNGLSNTNANGYCTFLVKYDAEGNSHWAKLINSPQSYSTSVTLDGSGNVYVSGGFYGSLSIGSTNLTTAGEEDGFLAKFNTAGDFQWVRQMKTTTYGGDLSGVAADASGHVYVAGGFGLYADDTICFESSICVTNIGSGFPDIGVGDAFLVKYDGSTGRPQWAVRAGGTNPDFFVGISTDPQGNIYVGGASQGPTIEDDFKAVIAKYDTNGVLQWTQSSTGTNGAFVFARPVVDSAGNCYAAGWFHMSTGLGTDVLTGSGYHDLFLAKVGSAPLPLALGIEWGDSVPRLSLTGEIGTRFALESSAALGASSNWQPFLTNVLASSPFLHTDANIKGNSTRFYRAKIVP